jgi:4-diphosphocytidyl-2C-methyl-D-erythritol kinase
MAQDRSPQTEPEQPAADDPLAGLRRLANLAKDLGVSDVATFTEMLESARNEGRGGELLKPIKSLVDQFAGQPQTTKTRSDLGARLMSLVSGAGPSTIADLQDKAELALLRRIEELSGTASIEGVLDLATAYARLCSGRTPTKEGDRRDE